VFCPFNWPGHELWKKADKGRESNEIFGRGKLLFIYVNRVAQRLKGVKTNPHWQNDVKCIGTDFLTEKRKRIDKVIDEKIIVFEKAQKPDVDYDTDPQQQFSE